MNIGVDPLFTRRETKISKKRVPGLVCGHVNGNRPRWGGWDDMIGGSDQVVGTETGVVIGVALTMAGSGSLPE